MHMHAALRLRRRLGPTPHPFRCPSASALLGCIALDARRHLSLGVTEAGHANLPPPATGTGGKASGTSKSKPQPVKQAATKTRADSNSNKPAEGTLLRALGDAIHGHDTWNTESLVLKLERTPRLWSQLTQLLSSSSSVSGAASESESESAFAALALDVPERPRGWPTPVVTPVDVAAYFPQLYANGWFVEHDTPLESGERGVPALAKHFARITPEGGSMWEQQRSPNFRTMVQALEKQENHHVLLREDEFAGDRYDTIFIHTHSAVCKRWVLDKSSLSEGTPSAKAGETQTEPFKAARVSSQPAGSSETTPRTYRYGTVHAPGITLRDVRFALLLDDLHALALEDVRRRLRKHVYRSEWWDFSASSASEDIDEGSVLVRSMSLRPLAYADVVHDELPIEGVKGAEALVRKVEEAGEGVLEIFKGKVREVLPDVKQNH